MNLKIYLLSSFLCLSYLLNAQPEQQIIDQYARASLSEFYDFLSLPNDANNSAEMEPNIQWASKAFAKRGFKIQRLPTAGVDLVLAEKRNPKAEKTVLFYVQADGQPVDPRKWFQETPYTPTLKQRTAEGEWEAIPWSKLEGDIDPEWRVFARSTADSKGAMTMFLAAMDALEATKITPDYNIKIIMDFEEELGSPNLPAAVEKHRKALAADYLVILDGPMHVTNLPTMKFGARGIATVRLTTYGPRVPQHSGHYGNYAPNPAFRLMQLIGSMKDAEGRVIIPGFYDGVQITPEVKAVLEAVPDDEVAIRKAIGIAGFDKVGETLQEAVQYPSLNVRGMSAGWVGNKVRTIVPAAAVANIDVRLVKESDPERLIASIKKYIEDQGYHFTESGGEPSEAEREKYARLISMNAQISYEAFRTNLNTPIDHWLTKALKKVHNADPIKIRTTGGSVPIAPFVNTLKVPAVIVPVVNPDNNQHSPNENLRISNYFMGVKTIAGILATSTEE
jgi:acetylornithine deacetylase/succinyl-diaminopimelate desuccinylase-like protein